MLLKPRIMELCLGTCPHDRSETRKASAKSPLFQRHFFLSVQRRFKEFLARPLPQSFTLVLEPWNFSLLYLLLIVSIIMFQGSMFYVTRGCYSSCRRTSPKFCVSLSFVSHVKRACASSAPILLRSLVCDLLLLQSLEWELACSLSLLHQGNVDDEGFVFSLRLTSYTSVTK